MSRTIRLIVLVLLFAALMFAATKLYNNLVETAPDISSVSVEAEEADTEETEREPAPDFTVYDADGKEVHLSDFRGTPVVLNFWASWCPPCKQELPDFNEAFLREEGIRFMMVNLTDGQRETLESAGAFIEEMGYGFPVYFDTEYSGAAAYGVSSIPATYLIDAEGNLVAYAVGMISADALQQGIDMIKN